MKYTFPLLITLFLYSACSTITTSYQEQFRPQFHYSPMKNWLNDPNGMFYFEGEYHLFYQYHPHSTTWGPMHWGHAVSKDLVTWKELPIALSPDEKGMIFSGSAVVDWNNSSGFGSAESPPIVAMFTYHNQEMADNSVIPHQTQAIAYSLDKGRSWSKYEGNPVIENPGIVDFRDPKVVWDDENGQWVMVLAQEDHIGFYTSDNLREWRHVSNFGKDHGTHSGVWECPDLLKMKIEGTDEYRYVLLVSINPGGPNGGSATQYFVGDWDGKNFTPDPTSSKSLRVKAPHFPEGELIDGFEEGYSKWKIHGDAFLNKPTMGNHVRQWPIQGFVGNYLANSFSDGDYPQGELLSLPFTITQDYINFYVAGGYEPERVSVQLISDGQVIKTAGGNHTNKFVLRSFSVSDFKGKKAQIRIIDRSSDPWGFIMVDQLTQSERPAENAEEHAMWLDWGTDNYAGVTFANTQEVAQHPIFMGWMNNWDYARNIPTSTWRGAMTLPRTLRLVKISQGFRVTSQPVENVNKILGTKHTTLVAARETKQTELPANGVAKINLDFSLASAGAMKLLFHNSTEALVLNVDISGKLVELDRNQVSYQGFSEQFQGIVSMPLESVAENNSVEIWLDTSSIEVFTGNGKYTMTSRIFPTLPFSQLTIQNQSPNTSVTVSIQNIKSIWEK